MDFRGDNREKFEYFVAWTLAPRSSHAMDEKTMAMLAAKLGVSEPTLFNWSKCDEFVKQSEICRRGLAQLRKNRIEAEAYDQALALGWQDKAFFMKCFGDWKEKTETTHRVISFTDIVDAEHEIVQADKPKELPE